MNQRDYRFPGDRITPGPGQAASYGEEAQAVYVATVKVHLLEALEAFSALLEADPQPWTAEGFAGVFRAVQRAFASMSAQLDSAGFSPLHNWRIRVEERGSAFARCARVMEGQIGLVEVDVHPILAQMGTTSRRRLANVARMGKVLVESYRVGLSFEDWHRWADAGLMVTIHGDPRGAGTYHALTPLGLAIGQHLLSHPQDLELQGLDAMPLGDLVDLQAALIERARASRPEEEYREQDLAAIAEALRRRAVGNGEPGPGAPEFP